MIYFGIPLRSKAASKDWKAVTKVFNRTLASVYNQTDPNFKIIVACHDIPKLDREYDDRVVFIQSSTQTPKSKQEMMMDKGYKVSLIGEYLKKIGGGYLMLVDSDDMISNKIAGYVNAHPECTGFMSSYGYIYNDGYSYMKKFLFPYRTCGSCTIVNYNANDLPDRLPYDLNDNSLNGRYIIKMSHRYIPPYLKKNGRQLKCCPFITTIYVRNTGDNHSMLGGNDLNMKRRIELLLRRKVWIDDEIRREFFGE